jgi:hypothetical protein
MKYEFVVVCNGTTTTQIFFENPYSHSLVMKCVRIGMTGDDIITDDDVIRDVMRMRR